MKRLQHLRIGSAHPSGKVEAALENNSIPESEKRTVPYVHGTQDSHCLKNDLFCANYLICSAFGIQSV